MNQYELAVVLPGETTAAKKKAFVEKIKKLITTLKGKVGKVEDWGKKDLALPIKKHTTGVYLFFPLELGGAAAAQIDGKLRMEEEIVRYLLIRK